MPGYGGALFTWKLDLEYVLKTSMNTIKGMITEEEQVVIGLCKTLNPACIVKGTMLSSLSAASSSVFFSALWLNCRKSQRGGAVRDQQCSVFFKCKSNY